MLKKQFLLSVMKSVLLHFVENVTFFQNSLMNVVFKEQHLFQMEVSCNIINVFIVTFDQFIASFLNQILTSYKSTDSDFFYNVVY